MPDLNTPMFPGAPMPQDLTVSLDLPQTLACVSTPAAVVAFWREAGPARWFAKSDEFDEKFRQCFLATHMAAARRELDDWTQSAEGALALLIVLDQFPRNAFRGTAHMYATDPLAQAYALAMIAAGQDHEVEVALRAFCFALRAFWFCFALRAFWFCYMPLEHAEDAGLQARCVALMTPLGGQSLEYAQHHADIIASFGRFPHRNPLLGRVSTQAELDYMAAGGFTG